MMPSCSRRNRDRKTGANYERNNYHAYDHVALSTSGVHGAEKPVEQLQDEFLNLQFGVLKEIGRILKEQAGQEE